MNNILTTLLEVSVYSAIIFAAVMLIRTFTRGKLSPILQAALWLVLVVRLCLPVTFDSGFHFITLPQQQTEEQPAAAAGQPSWENEQNTSAIPVQQTEQKSNIPANSSIQSAPRPFRISWQQGLLLLWIGGAAAYGIFLITASHQLAKRYRQQPLAGPRIEAMLGKCKKQLGIKRNIHVVLVDGLSSPALTISIQPRILFPAKKADMLSDEALCYALMHELTHLKRGDHLLLLAWQILSIAYWFNPVIWFAAKHLTDDIEGACDYTVAQAITPELKSSYAKTLVQLSSEKPNARLIVGMALGASRKNMEQRIHSIYAKKSKASVKIVSLLLVAALGVCCFTTACQPAQASTAAEQAKTQAESEQPQQTGLFGSPPLAGLFSDLASINESDFSFATYGADYNTIITIPADNLFDTGKVELKDETAEELIARICEKAKPYLPYVKDIIVEGHTDNTLLASPTAQVADNLDLSSKRAINTASSMIETLEIDFTHFTVLGKSEFDPMVENDTPENRAMNRRIEIVFLSKDSPYTVEDYTEAEAQDPGQAITEDSSDFSELGKGTWPPTTENTKTGPLTQQQALEVVQNYPYIQDSNIAASELPTSTNYSNGERVFCFEGSRYKYWVEENTGDLVYVARAEKPDTYTGDVLSKEELYQLARQTANEMFPEYDLDNMKEDYVSHTYDQGDEYRVEHAFGWHTFVGNIETLHSITVVLGEAGEFVLISASHNAGFEYDQTDIQVTEQQAVSLAKNYLAQRGLSQFSSYAHPENTVIRVNRYHKSALAWEIELYDESDGGFQIVFVNAFDGSIIWPSPEALAYDPENP